MRIAAHLGVLDEIELIERVIVHLKAIGIDLIIVCDMYSTDGTAEILEKYKSEDFWILRIANSEPIDVWLSRNKEIIQKARVDWIVFLDADEFLLPASGSLKDCTGLKNYDLLNVRRYNVPLGPEGPIFPDQLVPGRYDGVELIVEEIPRFREHLQKNPSTPIIRYLPPGKIMVRPEQIGALTEGMHTIVPAGPDELRNATPDDLIIAHLPITTASRFARRLKNIRECFAHHDTYLGPHLAWHWRWWLSLADRGEIEQEFERSIFSSQLLDKFRRKRIIRTAVDLLNADRVKAEAARAEATTRSFPTHFDENFYLLKYPDVAAAVAAGKIMSGHDHFLRFGRVEGRQGAPTTPDDADEEIDSVH